MNPVPKNHTPLVVVCVTLLGTQAAIMGGFLLWKGFTGGSELVLALNSAITGLIGFLGGRATAGGTPAIPPDITISGQPPTVSVAQPQPTENHNP